MRKNPLVTVIIPTYNRSNLLPGAINSVLDQTYKNVEIIVVDDGSTDNTAEIIKQFEGIKYLYKENGGQGSARNEGLKHSTGDLIASLDSDDEWLPTFLERCVNKIVDDGMDFVFANWEQINRDGCSWDFLSGDPFVIPYFHKKQNNWIELNYAELRNLYLQSCPSPSSSLITKRSLITKGWNPKMKIGDDWYLYLTMILERELKAAFTLDKLWKKTVDDKNVYDGRKRSEVLRNLYISDLSTMLKDFKNKITTCEYKLMQKNYVYGMVELAKHKLIREFCFIKSAKLLSRSFRLDTLHTLKSIYIVAGVAYKRSINDLRQEKSLLNKNAESH